MKVDYRTKYYFPKQTVTAGHALIFMGAVVLTIVNWIAGASMISLGLFIVSVNHGLVIDTQKKVYRNYIFLLGCNIGKKKNYDAIESLYVTVSKKATVMQSRASNSEIIFYEFNGFIKFSEGEEVHLLSSRKKQKVMHFMDKISMDLDLDIIDKSL